MAKLIEVKTREIRHKSTIHLQLTDGEVSDLIDFLDPMQPFVHFDARPRLLSLLHVLRNGPVEVKEETVER